MDTPGCFYGWGLFFVFIDMSTNLQAIPLGLIAIQPYLDFETIDGSFVMDEGSTISILQNDAFVNPPSVFLDGILLTYIVSTNRRYVEFDATLRRIIIRNGIVQLGEYVQIFL